MRLKQIIKLANKTGIVMDDYKYLTDSAPSHPLASDPGAESKNNAPDGRFFRPGERRSYDPLISPLQKYEGDRAFLSDRKENWDGSNGWWDNLMTWITHVFIGC